MKIERDFNSEQLVMEEWYDSFYAEIEREISILTADNNEGSDRCGSRTHSSSRWMAKRSSSISYMASKQQESYFCWSEKDEGVDSVPSWISSLWRNSNGSGTGVFIPQITVNTSRRRNKPRKKRSNEKERTYMPVATKKR